MDRDSIREVDPDMVLLEPAYLDEAIMGICGRPGLCAVLYDSEKVIDLTAKHEGMSLEDAEEWCNFNTFQLYVGEKSPVFAMLPKAELQDPVEP